MSGEWKECLRCQFCQVQVYPNDLEIKTEYEQVLSNYRDHFDHHEHMMFQCKICVEDAYFSEAFPTWTRFKGHMKEVHYISDEEQCLAECIFPMDQREAECKACGLKRCGFGHDHLMKHVRENHNEQTMGYYFQLVEKYFILKCRLCATEFYNLITWNAHFIDGLYCPKSQMNGVETVVTFLESAPLFMTADISNGNSNKDHHIASKTTDSNCEVQREAKGSIRDQDHTKDAERSNVDRGREDLTDQIEKKSPDRRGTNRSPSSEDSYDRSIRPKKKPHLKNKTSIPKYSQRTRSPSPRRRRSSASNNRPLYRRKSSSPGNPRRFQLASSRSLSSKYSSSKSSSSDSSSSRSSSSRSRTSRSTTRSRSPRSHSSSSLRGPASGNRSDFYCSLCNKDMVTKAKYVLHIESKQHLAAIRGKSIISLTKCTKTFYCGACGCYTSGRENFKQHLEGKKHKKNLKNKSLKNESLHDAQKSSDSSRSSSSSRCSSSNGSSSDSRASPSSKDSSKADKAAKYSQHKQSKAPSALMEGKTICTPKQPSAFSQTRVYCKLCKIFCPCQISYKQHLDGKQHRTNLILARVKNPHVAIDPCGSSLSQGDNLPKTLNMEKASSLPDRKLPADDQARPQLNTGVVKRMMLQALKPSANPRVTGNSSEPKATCDEPKSIENTRSTRCLIEPESRELPNPPLSAPQTSTLLRISTHRCGFCQVILPDRKSFFLHILRADHNKKVGSLGEIQITNPLNESGSTSDNFFDDDRCPFCHISFDSSHFSKHLNRDHLINLFRCTLCPERGGAFRLSILKNHLNEHIYGNVAEILLPQVLRFFLCGECAKEKKPGKGVFTHLWDSSTASVHFHTTHDQLTVINSDQVIFCRLCEKNFDTELEFEAHECSKYFESFKMEKEL